MPKMTGEEVNPNDLAASFQKGGDCAGISSSTLFEELRNMVFVS